MSDLIEALKERLESKKHELSDSYNELTALNDRIYIIKSDIKSYERTLAAELKAAGRVEEAENLLNESNADNSQSNNDFLLDVVRALKFGAKPSEIITAFEDAQVQVHKNYIYTLLMRLKRQGRIVESGGRYFIAPTHAATE